MLGNISSLCIIYILSVLPRWQRGERDSRACGFIAVSPRRRLRQRAGLENQARTLTFFVVEA